MLEHLLMALAVELVAVSCGEAGKSASIHLYYKVKPTFTARWKRNQPTDHDGLSFWAYETDNHKVCPCCGAVYVEGNQ